MEFRTRPFARHTSGDAMLAHRHAWRRKGDTFEVFSRDGKTTYEVSFDGVDLTCTCPARGRCWHMAAVARRLLRERVAA